MATKMFYSAEGTETYICGATADIKAIYKSIARQGGFYFPRYTEMPKFSESKQVYAICLEDDGQITIINSDTMLAMVLAGEVVPA